MFQITLTSTKGGKVLTGGFEQIAWQAVSFLREYDPAHGIDLEGIEGREGNLETEAAIREALEQLCTPLAAGAYEAERHGFEVDQRRAGECRWYTADGIAGVAMDTADDFDADGERIERATFTVLDRDGFPVEKHETAEAAFASAAGMAKRAR